MNSFGEHIPLSNEIDRAILLHREIHFGGKFSFMLDYYAQGGKGVMEDFSLERIQELAVMEEKIGGNLAALTLTGADAEQVLEGRRAYLELRKVYEKGKNTYASLVADLILSEEEYPQKEIDAILQKDHEKMIPLLLEILKDPKWRDPLSPGYGTAPSLVTECLKKMGNKKTIISLFETIGEGDFFDDEHIFSAFFSIGDKAKEFLIKILQSKPPIRSDHSKAAMALSVFSEDKEVYELCFSLLKNDLYLNDPSLSPYLLYIAEEMARGEKKQEWLDFIRKNRFPSFLKTDVELMRKKYG